MRVMLRRPQVQCSRFQTTLVRQRAPLLFRSRRLLVSSSSSSSVVSSTRRSSWSEILSSVSNKETRPSWSEEWKRLGLGAQLVDVPAFPANLFFVQVGHGVDQHGKDNDATKAAVRAVRNAIEFNSIPGVITHLPGGRHEMLVHVKLGVPAMVGAPDNSSNNNSNNNNNNNTPMHVDLLQVAKVFPYGKLLPVEVCVGGLSFHTGRVVEELGDSNDLGVYVAACISLGYGGDEGDAATTAVVHKTYNTKDGY